MRRLFVSHPATVGESYLEHAAFAARFGGTLALAAGAAFVHAVFPFLFEKTASRLVLSLAERVQNRGR